MRTMHGMHVRDFPNLFIVGFVQAANLVSNVTSNLVEAGTTIAAVVAHALEVGAKQVEVTPAAEEAWVKLLEGAASMLGEPRLHARLLQQRGPADGPRARSSTAPATRWARSRSSTYIDEWRSSGKFEGLEFRSAELTHRAFRTIQRTPPPRRRVGCGRPQGGGDA